MKIKQVFLVTALMLGSVSPLVAISAGDAANMAETAADAAEAAAYDAEAAARRGVAAGAERAAEQAAAQAAGARAAVGMALDLGQMPSRMLEHQGRFDEAKKVRDDIARARAAAARA